MIKRITFILLTAMTVVVLSGCGSNADEPDVKVPIGKVGDGGPQPANVSAAGGAGAPAGGGTQAPVTE